MQFRLRFPYNSMFLPEYFSTILISAPVSLLFVAGPLRGGARPGVADPHTIASLVLYLALALGLVALTIAYRLVFRGFVFESDRAELVLLRCGPVCLDVSEVDLIEERVGDFFGRQARYVYVFDKRGSSMAASEAVVQFEGLKRTLRDLTGLPVADDPLVRPELVHRIRREWYDRHRLFPVPKSLSGVFDRLLWRLVCLLPVGVCDVMVNVMIILMLGSLRQMDLMVYSAPLSLLTSGIIARYVYYYLFTSALLNRPLGKR